MGYSTNMAAALSGVTTAQLRDWRRDRGRGPVLCPDPGSGPPLYSFGDVLALRAFVRLGRGVPLRRIREALSPLGDPDDPGRLPGWWLITDGSRVTLAPAPPGPPGPGRERLRPPARSRPRRPLLTSLSGVLTEFTPGPGVVVPHLLRPRFHVRLTPGTQGGHPVISGTRVPFDAVADLVHDGVPPERIAEHYPGVSPAAARDAASFARYVDSYRTHRSA